jgi:hypothetical protein
LFAVCALALLVAVIVAGCGGDDDEASGQDPQTVLDETFSNDESISSGDLNLTLGVEASGDQGGSLEVSLSGPFQRDPEDATAIPQLDWTATATGSGPDFDLDFTGGLVVTADNAYVEYNDNAYEVGSETFTQVRDQLEAQADAGTSTSFAEGCKQALEQAGATDTSGCDIDLQTWLTNLSDEGTADVAGAPTVHVYGDLDVNQVLTDIADLVMAFPGASDSGFDPAQLGVFESAVTEASMDVYSGESDHLLRKLEVNLGIDPSAIPGGESAAIDNVEIDFVLELASVNEQQTIEAPSNAQPISQLLSDLGISANDLDEIPGLPDTSGGDSGGGSDSSDSGGGSTDDYFECIQEAGSDPEAINKCASLL